MITLAQILRDHQTSLQQHYGARLRPEHHAALQSILACHTPDCGQVRYQCSPCQQTQTAYPSCGHRSCPACYGFLRIASSSLRSSKGRSK
ncbi:MULTISPECIES: transposase zinc-binding domain-containing protein [Marinobacter]|uniref:Transposase zinc-binding domain-containing protein n=1 Tax=Marinobacter metalliresistant TaxID=2961995 RepID=A0ABZ2VXN8_9GAMM|nr:transposase zinc-binding domain-containing protein [Marinobacter sp. Arc7-DN-1]